MRSSVSALPIAAALLALAQPSHADTPPASVVAVRVASPVCELPNPVDCSGVVIAPTVVLTAAHCVAGATSELEVVVGVDAAASTDVLAVAEIRIHPRYQTGAPAADLALLRLRWPTAAPVLPIGEAPHLGETLAWAGYGNEPPTGEPGHLHGGTAQVTAVGDGVVTLGRGALPCSGDSGGAMLRDTGTRPIVVALTRSGDAACAERASGVILAAHVADFITPFVTTSGADAPLDLADPRTCGAACTDDTDCPTSFTCTTFEGEPRCIHAGLPPGHLAAACESAAQCGGAPCFALVTERGRVCGCLEPCAADPPSGCAVDGEAGWPGVALGLLVLVMATRRPQPRRAAVEGEPRARSPRSRSSPRPAPHRNRSRHPTPGPSTRHPATASRP